MGRVTLGFLLLLAACSSRGSTGVGSGPAGIEVADAALRGGSPELALQITDSILLRTPDNEAALLTQGEALTALGRLEAANASFHRALAIDPTSVGGHIGIGRILLASNPAAAEAQFLDALSREPRNAVALNNLGIARDLQGRHTDAQNAYREALGVRSDMTAAQVNLALSLAMGGQARDAVQLLRPLASDPAAPAQIRHDLAAVLMMSGNRAEAERILSKDLPPNEVREALDAIATARPSAAASLLTPEPLPDDAAAPVRAAAPTRTAQVQLAGSLPSREAAGVKWQRMREEMPDLLGGREPILAELNRDGQADWRVRVGGFANAGEAGAFCERVRAAGTTCATVR